jgi:hypothetical protein
MRPYAASIVRQAQDAQAEVSRTELKLCPYGCLRARGIEWRWRTTDGLPCLIRFLASLGMTRASLGKAKASLGMTKASLGKAKASLGMTRASLGKAKASLGMTKGGMLRAEAFCG